MYILLVKSYSQILDMLSKLLKAEMTFLDIDSSIFMTDCKCKAYF